MTPSSGPSSSGEQTLRPGDTRILEQYLSHLRIERGLSQNTLSAYRRDLERYLAELAREDVDPADVDPQRLTDWVQTLRTGSDGGSALSASSVARALAAVRGLHSFLDAERVSTTGDPSRLVPTPSIPSRLPHPLSIDQVEALLTAAGSPGTGRDSAERALRDRALLELLYGIGARISEAIGLDLDDVDRDQRCVTLRGKGDKHRIVPVGRYALEALDAYLTRGRPALAAHGAGTAAIFLGSRGTRLTRQAAWQVVQRAAEDAELGELPTPISPHTLRHSYATHLLHGGADVRSVQELLGHASVTTTQLYTQVTVDSLRETHAGAHPRARRGA
ncbi:site-specific tyrosine recombinase XerD [Brachybacterium alimentarium]|uniref:site-specific tyrosine recombinase XerD n=1 Tax=Brachybacterium alimentarium TaxID=47845 RepID=UPI000DF2DEEE|nr:site-specific tyrosine recombinase XerD [Brachybacterium alimentarium]RCS68462.1 site-specific tyrosine recombinase XerD [Brachybacterium alimentarium]